MMKQYSELKLSSSSEKMLREAITELGKSVDQEMRISSIDQLRISLDFNRHTTGKFMGVKITATKIQQTELLYDEEGKESERE